MCCVSYLSCCGILCGGWICTVCCVLAGLVGVRSMSWNNGFFFPWRTVLQSVSAVYEKFVCRGFQLCSYFCLCYTFIINAWYRELGRIHVGCLEYVMRKLISVHYSLYIWYALKISHLDSFRSDQHNDCYILNCRFHCFCIYL